MRRWRHSATVRSVPGRRSDADRLLRVPVCRLPASQPSRLEHVESRGVRRRGRRLADLSTRRPGGLYIDRGRRSAAGQAVRRVNATCCWTRSV